MTWPNQDVDTQHLDSGTDSPALARADLHDLALKFNQLRAHVSGYIQGLLDDVDAAAARATLGAASAAELDTAEADIVALDGRVTTNEGDIAALEAATVVTWTLAVQVGNGLAIATPGQIPALTALTGARVAYIDSGNNDLRKYRFDGTDLVQEGSELNIATANVPALAALSDSDVAYIDSGNDELRVYRFPWAQVGNSLAIVGAGLPSLAALNSTDVAFFDAGNEELRVYRFDGLDWAQVGSSLAISGAGSAPLAALNGTDVALLSRGFNELRTYRFNGSDWAQVGNSLSIPSSDNLAGLSGDRVAVFGGVTTSGAFDELRMFRFDGLDWTQISVGTPIGNAAKDVAIIGLNGTDVALFNHDVDELQVYRFGFHFGAGPHRP